ncbi:histone deacetylase [Streptomyces sp. 4N509B]|uniref:histone deacetylase n=1 Tax=Streptomyces sp. 4N509B TaxID=3457413 RepID=UPI003FD3C162
MVEMSREFPDRSSRIRCPKRVWYAAYGSNMHPPRLTRYLRGGRPPGGRLAHPGCRDPRPPERVVPLVLPGLLFFATESAVWGGGRAFFDPHPAGLETPVSAYLLTGGQFSDVAAQEMGRPPDRDLDLSGALRTGRARLGPGRYETLVCPGSLAGHPVVTFTAPRGWDSGHLPLNAPAAGYLRHLGAGLMTTHGWSAERAARYLATRPGARGVWTPEAVREVLEGVTEEESGGGGGGGGPERLAGRPVVGQRAVGQRAVGRRPAWPGDPR